MIPADTLPPCRDNPDLHFDEGKPSSVTRAKAVCAGCPLSTSCLSYALAHDVSGVWAATTTDERHKLRKRAGIIPAPIVSNPYPNTRRLNWPGRTVRAETLTVAGYKPPEAS